MSEAPKAYCSAIGVEVPDVRSERASMFEAFIYDNSDDVERVRDQVINTLIEEWEFLRVFDVENRGRSHYGETFFVEND